MGKFKLFTYGWRKLLAGVFDFLLHTILLGFCSFASLFLTGLVDIAFKSKVFINPWISIPLALFMFTCPFALASILPKKIYRRTPGQSIVEWSLDHKGGLKPFILFAKIWLVVVIVLFSTRWVTTKAFGSMAQKQLRTLETMGVTLDPQSYYPAFDTLNNAAPHFREAINNLDGSTVSTVQGIYRTVIRNPDTLKALSSKINQMLQANQASLRSLDKALEHPNLMWEDYHDIPIAALYNKKDNNHPPNFMILGKVCLLGALIAGYENDSESCERYLNRAIGIARLEREEPSQLSGMVSVAVTEEICGGLATLMKVVPKKSEGYLLVRKALLSLPPMVGITQKGERQSFVWLNSFIHYGPLSFCNHIWPQWQDYCFNKYAVLAMRCTVPENDLEEAVRIGKDCEDFLTTHSGFPAFGLIFSTSPHRNYHRELAARAAPDAVLLFTAAVAYRSKHGGYPVSLKALIPEYLDELPQSPFDHKDYLFRTSGDSMEVYALGVEGKHVPGSTIIGQ